ncbi:MAG TPA: hypothetical protein VGH22_02685 [Candidatus Binatia bacterium]|jgi:hypothetical protein
MKSLNARHRVYTSKSTDQETIRWTEARDVFDRLEKGLSEVIEDHVD